MLRDLRALLAGSTLAAEPLPRAQPPTVGLDPERLDRIGNHEKIRALVYHAIVD